MTKKSGAQCDQNNKLTGAIAALIALMHTHILYFKGVGWILNTFFCSMPSANFGVFVCPCLCTSPSEQLAESDSVFFHCARYSPQTLNIRSQVCRACWDPANQNISTLSQNIQQPIRTSSPFHTTTNS